MKLWWLVYLPAEHRVHFWRDQHAKCSCEGTGKLRFTRGRLLRMVGR